MASIAFKNVDGSTLSRVTILKDGRALEVNPSAAAGSKKTWPSMDAWVQEMPKEWPRVEAWTASIASTATEAAGPTLHVRPQLAYFLKLPEGATTSTRAAIRDALASYMDFYKWGMSVHRAKRDLKPANPLYHLDDFLVTLTGLDPRGTFTVRQILNAVLARQTRTAPAVAPAVAAALGPLEETPLGSLGPLEETPSVPLEETPSAVDLAWHILRIMGENKRLKAEIDALKARLCTIRAAACI
jgi:hypothetical protein